MKKEKVKAAERLRIRRAAYDSLDPDKQRTRKRPGSMKGKR